MQQSEDLTIRHTIIATVDALPQAPADLRARTLARFRSEAAGLTAGRTPISGRRAVALTLGLLPAFVAWPLAAALGVERPLSVAEVASHVRPIALLSRLLRVA